MLYTVVSICISSRQFTPSHPPSPPQEPYVCSLSYVPESTVAGMGGKSLPQRDRSREETQPLGRPGGPDSTWWPGDPAWAAMGISTVGRPWEMERGSGWRPARPHPLTDGENDTEKSRKGASFLGRHLSALRMGRTDPVHKTWDDGWGGGRWGGQAKWPRDGAHCPLTPGLSGSQFAALSRQQALQGQDGG